MQIVAIVIAFALTAVAVTLTTRAVRHMLAVMKQGQPAPGRSDEPGRRSLTMVKETFGHTRMLQWHWVGIMHWFVYLGFIVLSSAVFAGYFQLFDQEFALPIIGHFFLFEWLSEGIGLLSTIGIVFLIVYRQLNHPKRKGRDSRFYGSNFWQAYFVEVMALFEGSAILFIRGAEYNLGQAHGETEKYSGFHFPISQVFGNLYPTGADSIGTLENIVIGIALFKIVLAMVWLIVIARNVTMGVAWHRFTAWPNIWFKRESSGRTALGAVKPLTNAGKPVTLDDIDDLDDDATLGVGQVEDFSWKGILDFTTCTECGRCQSQCPAWNTEKPLSPKLLITSLRDHAYAKAGTASVEGGPAGEGTEQRSLIGGGGRTDDADGTPVNDWFYNPEGADFVIDEDVLWSCTSCGACVQQCPVDIEHVDHIVDMRRYQVLVESNFPAELNGLFKGLENKGNPWNMSSSARLDWAKGLDFEVKVVGETIESLDEVDWLFWVGCAGAYEDRAKKTTRAVAELLDIAGISFGVLGNGETCTGDPARRAGNEFVFQGLAQQNVEVLTEAKAKKVVSTCAHCFNTLKNEYSQFGIELEVVHHTQLLNRLVREGKLTPVKEGAGAHKRSITYHDPCYIGRHNGVYTPPRELLQILPGATYVEMERNSERSFCCGAGGARMWMEENIGERININRTTEAVETGADQIAVGCPFCRVMLSDGLTMKQSKDEAREEVEILDVAQMLLASVKGEQATKLLPGAGAETKAAEARTAAAAEAKQAERSDQPVETKAEPEAGDETITDDTVVDTEDVGPAAKASGGSSLFDDASSMFDEPAPKAKTANEDKAPAEEAQAAEPTSSGGSLFDLGADDEPEPPKTESKAAEEKPAPASGGSLFDLGGDEPEAKADPEPEPKDEAKATEAKPAAKPAADLGSGGSLFDLGGDEPEAEAAPEPEPKVESKVESKDEPTDEPEDEPEATEEEPAAKPAADLGSGGSLFDIAAPAAPAPKAEPVAKTSEPEPEPESGPEPEPASKTEAEPAGQTEPEAAGAPVAEIPEGGSLFDIQAPEPAAAPAAKAAEVAEVAEPEAAAEPEAKSEPEAATEPEAKSEPEAAAEPEPESEPEPEPESEPEAEAKAAPATAVEIPAIPEGGSLFDIQAPEPAAAPAAKATQPEAAAEPDAEPEPTAEATSEPARDGEPGTLGGGAAVSAAATAIASDDDGEEAAEPQPAETAEPRTEEPQPDENEDEEQPETEPEPASEEKPKPVSSGEAHQPRTDVEIGEGSLFDL